MVVSDAQTSCDHCSRNLCPTETTHCLPCRLLAFRLALRQVSLKATRRGSVEGGLSRLRALHQVPEEEPNRIQWWHSRMYTITIAEESCTHHCR